MMLPMLKTSFRSLNMRATWQSGQTRRVECQASMAGAAGAIQWPGAVNYAIQIWYNPAIYTETFLITSRTNSTLSRKTSGTINRPAFFDTKQFFALA